MTGSRLRILFLLLVPALLAVGVFYFDPFSSGSKNENQQPGLIASVQGLGPGTEVSYEIVDAGGKALSGSKTADGKGELSIPAYELKSGVSYNLEVGKGKDSLRVSLNMDPKTGSISATGKGLEQFSEIKIGNPSAPLQTRADWAGMFSQTDKTGLNQLGQKDGYQLAFFDNGLLGAVADSNPLVIKVLDTQPVDPGCTGSCRTSYTPSCGGDVPIATCMGMESIWYNALVRNYVRSLQRMTMQFGAVMMQQAMIVGTFLDARQQLETQEKLRELQAEAHKDYHPGDQMCRFGSFVKSVARSEEKSGADKQALNRILMASYMGEVNSTSTEGGYSDVRARLKQFREVYCDPHDNNNGLREMCQHNPSDGRITAGELVGGIDPVRRNKDLDFPRTAGAPLTVDVNFSDNVQTPDEEDVIALAKNLYWSQALEPGQGQNIFKAQGTYHNARRLFAINNVAHNSFTHMVGMKSRMQEAIGDESGPSFMKSMMREFALSDQDIDRMLGVSPSYYAQMEVLTKKIYQNPSFYTNLYDKPANVKRIGVTMDAIGLMQGRDQYEASLRREMLLSLMVEEALAEHSRRLNDKISSTIKKTR